MIIISIKMRIQSSKVLDAQMRALGAIPQITAFSEMYLTLQTGLADGTENPPSNFWTQRLYEVQKYLTLSDHGYLGYAVIVNRKFWDDLSREFKGYLQKSLDDATRFANEIARKENDEAILKIKTLGKTKIITLGIEERERWRQQMVKVHQIFNLPIDRELLEAVYQETKFIR